MLDLRSGVLRCAQAGSGAALQDSLRRLPHPGRVKRMAPGNTQCDENKTRSTSGPRSQGSSAEEIFDSNPTEEVKKKVWDNNKKNEQTRLAAHGAANLSRPSKPDRQVKREGAETNTSPVFVLRKGYGGRVRRCERTAGRPEAPYGARAEEGSLSMRVEYDVKYAMAP